MKNHRSFYQILIVFVFLLQNCSKTKELSGLSDNTTTSRNVTMSSYDYYWYDNEKIPLFKNNNRKYILIESSSEGRFYDIILRSNAKLAKRLEPFAFSKTTQPRSAVKNDSLKWAIVETSVELKRIGSSIIYEAPFFSFTNGGEEYGLSHLFYVKLKRSEDITMLEMIAKESKVQIIGNNSYRPLWYKLACNNMSLGNSLEMANRFYEAGCFEASQPDLMVPIKPDCTNDTYLSSQWNLNNTGQYGGTAGMDINFCYARSVTQGSNNIIVAVIDHGIELTHPDLNIYSESYDTETGTFPSVVRGEHGTACAGIIAATANNNIGIAGIAPNCPLMSISNRMVIAPQAAERLADGFDFARTRGASIISNSWYYPFVNQTLTDAISNALSNGRYGKGCVVVFSSGNDNASTVNYPGSAHPDILVVGAMSNCGERKSTSSCDGEYKWGSNYGYALDIVAPGVLVPTTDLTQTDGYNPHKPIHISAGGNKISFDFSNRDYTVWFNGTSAAAPHVAGVAALILSVNPNLTQQQVGAIIEQTARKVGSYSYTVQSGRLNGPWNYEMGYGLLNAFAAVTTASCATAYFNDQIVSDNTIIAACAVESENVIVNTGVSLKLIGTQYVIIRSPFTVYSGASFETDN